MTKEKQIKIKNNKNTKSKKKPVNNVKNIKNINSTAPLLRNSPSSQRAVSAVCSLIDPFCVHAIGSKIMDNSNMRTVTFQQRYSYYLTSDSAGKGCVVMLPQYSNTFHNVMTRTTYDNYTPPTNYSNASAINSVSKYRIVSCGVKVRNICAPLTMSGQVMIRTGTSDLSSQYNNFLASSFGSADNLDIALRDVHDFCIIFTRNANPKGNFFPVEAASPLWSTVNAIGFLPVSVALAGAPPSTDVLAMDYYINYELVFDESVGTQTLSTPSRPFNEVIDNAYTRIQSSIPSYFNKAAEGVASYLENKAYQVLADFSASLGTRSSLLMLGV